MRFGSDGKNIYQYRQKDHPLELLAFLIDFVLHIDVHLQAFVAEYGAWVYADSLLFIVGALCGVGMLHWPLSCALLLLAAIAGDQCNYGIGRHIGNKAFHWPQSRWFNRRAFERAHAFYARWGGITIVLARFMPFARTFAPFVAGVAHMERRKFTAFNVGGAVLWVLGITGAGYFFGNLPWVQEHLEKIIWALILVPGLLAIAGAWRSARTPQ